MSAGRPGRTSDLRWHTIDKQLGGINLSVVRAYIRHILVNQSSPFIPHRSVPSQLSNSQHVFQ